MCIGFFGLLTVVLITLKLCHVIDWSVASPMIAGFVIGAAVMLFAAIVLALNEIKK